MFSTRPGPSRSGIGILLAVLLLGVSALVVYSQTRAFVWDEGFHLVAAALIAKGKTPYIDFCFPQAPLNAYGNAALLSLFGQTWRIPHLAAALFAAGAMVLAAEFVVANFPSADLSSTDLFSGDWRWTAASCAAIFIGLNTIVMQFGTVAQAYGSGLFFSVAGFRAGVAAVNRKSLWLALATGLLAGAAAGCTLLTVPVVPVLFVWSFVNNRAGDRWRKAGAFFAGAAIPLAPVAWLFLRAPAQVFFNIVQYQALYRRANWPGATLHDIGVLSAWAISTQALLLGLLALAGLGTVFRKLERGSPFRLAAWLSLALGLFNAVAHPTFERYFVFMVPFVSILATVGLQRIGSKKLAALAAVLVGVACARTQLDASDATTWADYEKVARKVAEVTPPDKNLYAEELVYFALGRTPPTGLEFSYSRNVQLPREREQLFHIVSQPEFKQQIQAGRFDTVQSCKDDLIEDYELASIFPHQADVEDCSVFWGKVKSRK